MLPLMQVHHPMVDVFSNSSGAAADGSPVRLPLDSDLAISRHFSGSQQPASEAERPALDTFHQPTSSAETPSMCVISLLLAS